jgi:hypothetical protein
MDLPSHGGILSSVTILVLWLYEQSSLPIAPQQWQAVPPPAPVSPDMQRGIVVQGSYRGTPLQ